jgi:hypothetical protein
VAQFPIRSAIADAKRCLLRATADKHLAGLRTERTFLVVVQTFPICISTP